MERTLFEEYNNRHHKQNSQDEFVNFLYDNSVVDVPEINEYEAWDKLSHKVINKRSSNLLKIAASVILVLGASIVLWVTNPSYDQIIISSHNETKNVALPDGSVCILNTNSSIEYPEKFTNTREVTLTGEAYFDIVKSKSLFKIDANGVDVSVLGTAFNLNARSSLVNLYVERGIVAFNKKDEQFRFTEGQAAIFDKNLQKVIAIPHPDANSLAWNNGILKFEETPFSEVVSTLEKHYNVRFQFANDNSKNCLVSATFDNLEMDDVIITLETILSVTIDSKKSLIKVSGNGC